MRVGRGNLGGVEDHGKKTTRYFVVLAKDLSSPQCKS